MRLNISEGGADKKRVPCPFCGEGRVSADVITTYQYKLAHNVLEDGLEFNIPDDEHEYSFLEMIGEPVRGGADTYINQFRCGSCGKTWFSNEFRLVYDGNGQSGRFEDGSLILAELNAKTRRDKQERKNRKEKK